MATGLARRLFGRSIAVVPNTLTIMANGDLRVLVEGANGVLTETVLPKQANTVLVLDGSCVPKLVTMASLLPPLPKAGTVAVAAIDTLPGTKTITFNSAFLTGTTYVVEAHFNGLALVFTTSAQTTSGFTVAYSATLTGTLYWTATPVAS